MVLSAGCSLLKAEGFFCNLYVLYGGLGIGKLYFLIKKLNLFSAVNFFQFLFIKTLNPDWIRIGNQSKMPDPNPYQMHFSLKETRRTNQESHLSFCKVRHRYAKELFFLNKRLL
jgi:hypothetical protein